VPPLIFFNDAVVTDHLNSIKILALYPCTAFPTQRSKIMLLFKEIIDFVPTLPPELYPIHKYPCTLREKCFLNVKAGGKSK
jgi:hypothetical protein